jgi:hypothetical protein
MLDSKRLDENRHSVVSYALALDPGQTTGVCVVRNIERPWTFEIAQLGPKDHHLALVTLLRLLKPKVIICETFENRSQESAILASREYIGIVKMYLQMTQSSGVWQTASTGKKFWDDRKLHKHGLWVPGLKHARDAIRHYAYWRTFKQNDQSLLADPNHPVEIRVMAPGLSEAGF